MGQDIVGSKMPTFASEQTQTSTRRPHALRPPPPRTFGTFTKSLTLDHATAGFVDEGVTGSIPVAPTTQSVGIELRRLSVHLSRGTRAFRVDPRLRIGLQATKIRFSPVRLCIEKFRS
jgi:hypothetical protein